MAIADTPSLEVRQKMPLRRESIIELVDCRVCRAGAGEPCRRGYPRIPKIRDPRVHSERMYDAQMKLWSIIRKRSVHGKYRLVLSDAFYYWFARKIGSARHEFRRVLKQDFWDDGSLARSLDRLSAMQAGLD